jgi:drug/metabolite transporter (DMT)-like permease
MPIQRKTILVVLAFFAIYVIWGSTYLLNKIAVAEIPPLYLGAIRFIIAGILIFIIASALGHKLAVTKAQFINTLIAGFLFLTYGNGVFVWSLKYIDSGFAALIASTQPLVVILLMWMIDGKKIKKMSIVGVLLGIIGIYLLVSQNAVVSQEGSTIGIIMIFSTIVIWSLASIFVSKADLPSNFFVNSGYQMILGGFLMLIFSLLIGEQWSSPVAWTETVQFSMIMLIIFGSIVAFTSFNYLLKVVSTEKVATSAYVNPVIALFLGWYILDEIITIQSIIAAVVLLLGVYFINSNK